MRKRNINIDMLRCIAVISVLSVHFFLNGGFYGIKIAQGEVYVMTLFRSFFMICVPLFLLITGYLMNKKELTQKYYGNLVHTLGIYIIISIFCFLFKGLYLHESISIKSLILGILGFTTDPYSWYIEMYIGLNLLIPFLNILYQNIGDKKKKQLLIGTFAFLVSLPTLLNRPNHAPLIPDYWQFIWPLLYYFIGCYLSEYKVKISKVFNIVLLLLIILVNGLLNIYFNYNKMFLVTPFTDWYGWGTLITSVLLFILVINFDFNKTRKTTRRVILRISKLSLGIYLCSWITDTYLYGKLNAMIPSVTERFMYSIPIVLLTFIGSFILSSIAEYIYKQGKYLVDKIISFKKAKSQSI